MADAPSIDVETDPDRPGGTLCPVCGYDQRAATTNRCAECGVVLDRATLDRSGYSWPYRSSVGRVKAFLVTIWQVTVDRRSLRHEAAKPQSAADADVFRRWVTTVVALCFAVFATMLILGDGIQFVTIEKVPSFSGVPPQPGYVQDLVVPWSAGVTLWPALYGYGLLLAMYMTGATLPVLKRPGITAGRVDTAHAIARYTTAPLVWLLPAAVGYAILFRPWITNDTRVRGSLGFTTLAIVSFLSVVFALLATVYRTGQWRARVTHGGNVSGLLGTGELLLRWFGGCLVLLCVVPWCVGYVWLVVDSFRG